MNIPDEAINDTRLTDFQRILYGFIYEQCKRFYYCGYTNKELGERFNKRPEVISRNLGILEDYNYIAIERIGSTFGYFERKIYLSIDKK